MSMCKLQQYPPNKASLYTRYIRWINEHFYTLRETERLHANVPPWPLSRGGQPQTLLVRSTNIQIWHKANTTNIKMSNLPLCISSSFFSISVLSCLISWPGPAVCACATFGTSPPTGTCARPGSPNQDALLGSVQLTRLGNCTLTLIFMAAS